MRQRTASYHQNENIHFWPVILRDNLRGDAVLTIGALAHFPANKTAVHAAASAARADAGDMCDLILLAKSARGRMKTLAEHKIQVIPGDRGQLRICDIKQLGQCSNCKSNSNILADAYSWTMRCCRR